MKPTAEMFDWNEIEVAVTYTAGYSSSYREVYGYSLSHLEIFTPNCEALPISETGYKSQFERADNIEAEGGAVSYARAWLDHAARSPEWIAAQENARQLCLF